MEDQGKRLLLAVTLAIGIFFLWQVLFPAPKPEKKAKSDTVTEPQKSLESPVGMPIEGTTPEAVAPAPEVVAATRDEQAYDDFVAVFENGNLVSWKLTDPKYARDPEKGEMVAFPTPGAFGANFYKSSLVIPKNAVWTIDAAASAGDKVAYVYDAPELKVTKLYT